MLSLPDLDYADVKLLIEYINDQALKFIQLKGSSFILTLFNLRKR